MRERDIYLLSPRALSPETIAVADIESGGIAAVQAQALFLAMGIDQGILAGRQAKVVAIGALALLAAAMIGEDHDCIDIAGGFDSAGDLRVRIEPAILGERQEVDGRLFTCKRADFIERVVDAEGIRCRGAGALDCRPDGTIADNENMACYLGFER